MVIPSGAPLSYPPDVRFVVFSILSAGWLALGTVHAARRGPAGVLHAFPAATLTLVAILGILLWTLV